jgi:alpha-mannosidase
LEIYTGRCIGKPGLVRISENKVISAEKMAAMAKFYTGTEYPQAAFDTAWRTLLLSQHHDCWIVPYNGRFGNTWADKVVKWTGATNRITDSVITSDAQLFTKPGAAGDSKFVRVYNTMGVKRDELVAINIPQEWAGKDISVYNSAGQPVASQTNSDSANAVPQILFKAESPSMGYSTYQLKMQKASSANNMAVNVLPNGDYQVESDLYTITIDPKKGGTITSLIAKALNSKEFVDQANPRSFNELRGNFYNDGGYHSSADSAAAISIVEQGPERVKLQIKGVVDHNPFTQWLTLTQGQRRIDLKVKIDWIGNPGIGQFIEGKYLSTTLKKAFYSDREKLLAMFPVNLKDQKVYKNAPFDVLQSRLKNTFFNSWDSIKNNIVLNWVDVTDGDDAYGLALLTDHTTNYTHGEDFPLGLTLEYSGVGLWGRNYKITGPTTVTYAIIPHSGKWDQSGIWTEGDKWNEPLIAKVLTTAPAATNSSKSMLSVKGSGYAVTAINATGKNLLIRVFNAEGNNSPQKITFDGNAAKAELVELDGRKRADVKLHKEAGKTTLMLVMPRFGIRTIKLYNVAKAG